MTQPLLLSLFDESERRPLSVTELTMQVRGTLEARFASVWVEGEISNFKMAASGHWYFTIKDESAQLHAKCFRGHARAGRGRWSGDRAGRQTLKRISRTRSSGRAR